MSIKKILEETKDYSALKNSVSAENLEYFNDVINLYEGSKISIENDNLVYLDKDIKLKHENLAIRIIAWYEGMIETEEFVKEIITA